MNESQFKNQLKNYIKDGDFEYIIDKQKLLAEGLSEAEVNIFVKGKFREIFKANAKELFEQNESFFRQFKGIDGKPIENLTAFEKLVKDESFVKQLSNFIKIE
jgi:hypothetical protein